MRLGCLPAVILNSAVCQCALMIKIAFGRSGKRAEMLFKNVAISCHVSAGCQSIKKQGPAPCGINSTGWLTGSLDKSVVMAFPLLLVLNGYFQMALFTNN